MLSLRSRQDGNIAVIALVVLNVTLAGVLGWQVYQKTHKVHTKQASSSQKQTKVSHSSDKASSNATDLPATSDNAPTNSSNTLAIASRNTSRKDDASRLLAAVAEYMSNNNGSLPTGIDNNQLHGDTDYDYPTDVPTLSSYKMVEFFNGALGAVSQDGIAVVTNVTCNNDGSAVDSDSARQYVVLYGLENSDSTFTGTCLGS